MIQMTAISSAAQALKQVEAVQKAWKQALKDEGAEIKTLYDKTTETWSHDVEFTTTLHEGNDQLYVQVATVNRIYWFVHESISVMRGVLSPDWSPKTQPRVLSSGTGSGHLLYASKKIAKPPYPAREFTEKIIEERRDKFQQRMEKATQDGAKANP